MRIPITIEPEADFGSAEFSAEAISEAGSNDGDASSLNNVDSAQFVTTESASQETIARPSGNSAPNVSPIEVDATSGEAIEIDVTQYLRDREFDEMEIADFSQPTDDAGSVDLAGSTFTFTAKDNFVGDSTFEFSVTDIRGKQVDGLVAISVYPSELPKSGGGTFFEKVKIFISSIFSK